MSAGLKSGRELRSRAPRAPIRARTSSVFRVLGPGLVSGAADDDPSGIATYSQIGAQFGFSMLWTLVLAYPLMASIQETSAWIARVSGAGLARNLKLHYPIWVSSSIVAVLLVANAINLAADIAGMASAFGLIVGGPTFLYALLFGGVCLAGEIFFSYPRFAQLLKWATLVLFVYVATAFVEPLPLREIIAGALRPTLKLTGDHMTALTAVLGTTISPYLFFWQASQEVEEQKAAAGEQPLRRAPYQARAQLEPMRTDTYVGMAISNLIAFCIMLDTGAMLHARGTVNIETATQAAEALRPIGGEFALMLFAIGIIGTGLVAVPVLAGSFGYALAELCGWPSGLSRPAHSAPGFYGAIALMTLFGVGLCLSPVNPIKALFWSAVINGVAAGPIMTALMLMTTNHRITGGLRLSLAQWIVGWCSTLVMLAVSVWTVCELALG